MILGYCLRHARDFEPALSREGLGRTRRLLGADAPPLGAEPAVTLAVGWSSLCRVLAEGGGERRLPSGGDVRILDSLDAPTPAEYARLMSKGRLLYEHCLVEVSNACVIGFLHHELTKSLSARRVAVDLLGWFVEQRLALQDLVVEEGADALARIAHTEYVIDVGVSYLHGVDKETAKRLSASREP